MSRPTSARSSTRATSTTGTPATSRRSTSPRPTRGPGSLTRSAPGTDPRPSAAAPRGGAWIAPALAPRTRAAPAYIDIGQRYDGNGESEELRAFQTGGVLGSEFGPFRIPDPVDAVAAVRPPAGMTLARFRARRKA